MKIYLMTEGEWKLYEDPLTEEFKKRNITIGEGATIGERARIGEWARIQNSFDFILISNLGSRNATLTAYKHKDGIMIGTGCFLAPLDVFEKKVIEVHGDGIHGRDYQCAIKYIKERFKVIEVKR